MLDTEIETERTCMYLALGSGVIISICSTVHGGVNVDECIAGWRTMEFSPPIGKFEPLPDEVPTPRYGVEKDARGGALSGTTKLIREGSLSSDSRRRKLGDESMSETAGANPETVPLARRGAANATHTTWGREA